MKNVPSRLLTIICAFALCWHVLAVITPAWTTASKEGHGRDFASYYYALEVALEGEDPYQRRALGDASREDQTRRAVYPFFYPPPFLLTMLWTVPLDLKSAYMTWFWLDELCLLGVMLVLWRWWRPLGSGVGVILAVLVALLTSVPNNHLMGQCNIPVLFLVFSGLWAEDRDRPILGGILVGIGCMMKMSPGLFVLWWILRGRWKAVFSAIGTAVGLTLLSFAIVSPVHQWHFYTQVLPSFLSGDYNSLPVPIGMFGNHSIPNYLHQLFPGRPHDLSVVAKTLSTVTSLSLLGLLAWRFWQPPKDALARMAQLGAVGIVMLLLPVYTYEHHVVWALPAVVIGVLGLSQGRLKGGWAVVFGLAIAAWAFDLATLKSGVFTLRKHYWGLAMCLQEIKMVALLVFGWVCIHLGSSTVESDSMLPAGGLSD